MPDSLAAIALRPSIIRKNWLPLKMAVQEVLAFEQQFGKRHLLLACHAALPSYLTPELLNLVRLNFLDDENIPAIAEADFLLSPLCHPVDERLFEVEPAVREVLLVSLKRHYGTQQGEQRLVDLAAFLRKYLAEKSHHITRPDVLNTLHWIASSYLEPAFVLQELRKQFDESLSDPENMNEALVEQAELVVLLEKIAEPLERTPMQQEYQYLMHDSRVVAQMLYTDEPTDIVSTTDTKDVHTSNLSRLISPSLLNWIATSASSISDEDSMEPASTAEPVIPVTIDSEVERLLSLAGWAIQDYAYADIQAERGIAIRNLPTRSATNEVQSVDYLLFVDQQAAGIVLVIGDNENLIGTEKPTSLGIQTPLLSGERPRRNPLPFSYETNTQGTRVRFTNYLDPVTRTRSVFAFHRPETLGLWLQQAPASVAKRRTDLLRARLRRMPRLTHEGLQDVHYEAITGLEKSLAENRQRALIRLAPGSAKTGMLVSSIYRLLKFGNAQRVLYITDLALQSEQALEAFERSIPGDDKHTFANIYPVQNLSEDITFSPQVKVSIGTARQLNSVLTTQRSLDNYIEELSALLQEWENGTKPTTKLIRLLVKIQIMLSSFIEIKDLERINKDADPSITEALLKESDLYNGKIDATKITMPLIKEYINIMDYLRKIGIQWSATTIEYNPQIPIDLFDVIIIDDRLDYQEMNAIGQYFDAFLIGVTGINNQQALNFFNNNVVYNQPLLSSLLSKNPLVEPKNPLVNVCIICTNYEEARILESAFVDAFLEQLKHAVFQKHHHSHITVEYDTMIITNIDEVQINVHIIWLPANEPGNITVLLNTLVNEFKPRFVARISTCAGDKEKVKLGDIIVANQAFLYSRPYRGQETSEQLIHHVASLIPQVWSPPVEVLRFVNGFNSWRSLVALEQKARPVSQHQQRDWLLNTMFEQPGLHIEEMPLAVLNQHAPDWKKLIQELQQGPDAYLTQDMMLNHDTVAALRHGQEDFPFKDPKQPTAYIAPIASIDNALASESVISRDNILEETRIPAEGVFAVDIDGTTFYSAMSQFKNIHYLLVEGVSQYLDDDNDDSYRTYAAKVSALYLFAFIREYVTAERSGLGESDKSATRDKSSQKGAASVELPKENIQKELNIFYCYAPEDERMRKQLEQYLMPLTTRHGGPLKILYADITGGSSTDATLLLEQAQIILLLISADFLANDDLYENQLMKAFELQKEGRTRVIPILLRPVYTYGLPLEKSVVLPRNGRAISMWKNIDEAFFEVSQEIRAILADFDDNQL